jgi:hypothetical protein
LLVDIVSVKMTPKDSELPILRVEYQVPASAAYSNVVLSPPSSCNNDSNNYTMTQEQDIEQEQEESDKSIAKGGVSTPFPWKLHEMLDSMAKKQDDSIVCWQPHGRAFMVHDPKGFVTRIMPDYFNQTKYASFQRQLNLYGFSRLSHGRDKGAYYHQCFVRAQRGLCRNMIRQKIKGTKVRRSLSADEEPNFYSIKYSDASMPSPPLPTVPVVGKRVSRGRSPSKPRTKKRRTEEPGPEAPVQSLVSLMRERNPPAFPSLRPVLPSPTVIRPRKAGATTTTGTSTNNKNTMHQVHRPMASSAGPPATARGGDLLYFEGQAFRYLEHIEELPPPQSHHNMISTGLPPPPQSHHASLHDMISSIVGMDKSSWPQRTNTGQALYSS